MPIPKEFSFKMPKELKNVSANILKLLLPDVSVEIIYVENNAQVSHCHRATFKISYVPGFFLVTGYQRIEWRVIDKVNGVPQVVSEGAVYIPGSGGTSIVSCEFPMPSDASWNPDFNNEITVQVDPDKKFAERDETNNQVTFVGTCVG